MSPLQELVSFTWKTLERQVLDKPGRHGDAAECGSDGADMVCSNNGDIVAKDVISGNAMDYLLRPLPLDRANKLIETHLIDYVTDAFAGEGKDDPAIRPPSQSCASTKLDRRSHLGRSTDWHRTEENGCEYGAQPKSAESSSASPAARKSRSGGPSSSDAPEPSNSSRDVDFSLTRCLGFVGNVIRDHPAPCRSILFLCLCFAFHLLLPARRANYEKIDRCQGSRCLLLASRPSWSNYSDWQLAVPFNPLSVKLKEVRNDAVQQSFTAREQCDQVEQKMASCSKLRSLQATDLLQNESLTCWNCDLVGASMLCEGLGGECAQCEDKLLVLARSSANGLRVFRSMCSLGPALTYRKNFLKGRSGAIKEQWLADSRYPQGYGGSTRPEMQDGGNCSAPASPEAQLLGSSLPILMIGLCLVSVIIILLLTAKRKNPPPSQLHPLPHAAKEEMVYTKPTSPRGPKPARLRPSPFMSVTNSSSSVSSTPPAGDNSRWSPVDGSRDMDSNSFTPISCRQHTPPPPPQNSLSVRPWAVKKAAGTMAGLSPSAASASKRN
eukprot:755222-Hanusia_phi.AAC.1